MSSWRSPPPNVILENVCENFGQRACLFGDCVVSPVTNLSTCVCRPGFSHDVLWQRLENCASPGEYWSLVVHLVNIACGVVALALMCAYYRNLRGGAFRSVFFLGVTVTAFILASITFLSQGFGGRAYYFFNAVALSGFALCLAFFSDTLWGITQKAMKMSGNAKRNDRLMTIIRYCFFLSFLWLGVPFWPGFFYMLSLGDETDPNYDIVAANMAWTLPYPLLELHNFVFFPAFVTMSRYLISVIDESIERKRSGNNNALEASSTVVIIVRLQETRRRISLFTMLAAGVAAPMEFLLFVVLLPAIYFLKVPGMWLILGLEYAFVNCVVALILATLRTRTSRIKKMMEAELVASFGGRGNGKNEEGTVDVVAGGNEDAKPHAYATNKLGMETNLNQNQAAIKPPSSSSSTRSTKLVPSAVPPPGSPEQHTTSTAMTASINLAVASNASFSPPMNNNNYGSGEV